MADFFGGRGQRRRAPNVRYDYDQVSDSDDDASVDETNVPQQRRGGRAADGGNEATVPRSAEEVIGDIKGAVCRSLHASNVRENSLYARTYKPLLEELLQLGESLQAAGASTDVVAGAAERLIAVEKESVRRVAAICATMQSYDPSRFVGGGGGGGEGEGGEGTAAAAAAAAGDAAGSGEATDFEALLGAGGRRGRRHVVEDEEDESDEDEDKDEATAAPADPHSLNALAEIDEDSERLADIRGVAPCPLNYGDAGREGAGDTGAGGDVVEVRGSGGAAAVAAAAGNPDANVLLARARNARCPITSKRLADIEHPVEDPQGYVYERAAVEDYILRDAVERVGARRRGGAPIPARGAPLAEYPHDVVERATRNGVRAPIAGTGHFVTLGTLRPARRLQRELALLKAAGGVGGGGGTGAGAGGGGGADIEIFE